MKASNLHFLAQEWFDKADEDLAVKEITEALDAARLVKGVVNQLVK